MEFLADRALAISSPKKLVCGKEWIESGEYFKF